MTFTRRDKITALILFLLVSTIYFWTAAGITSTNDGSHYALTRSLADEGGFEISNYVEFTDFNDYSQVGDRYYSDRPPGTALLALPFYELGELLPDPPAKIHLGYDEDNLAVVTMMAMPAIAGALTVALFYLLLRGYELGQPAAITAALAFAFGSLSFKYAGVIFSHSTTALFVMAGVFFTLKAVRDGGLPPWSGLLIGFLLGYSVVTDYSSAIFLIIAGLYLLIRLNKSLFTGENWWVPILMLAIGGLIPTGFLLYYDTVNFGGPFTTSYTYVQTYEWARSFSTTFDFPLWPGLKGMLWAGWDYSEHNEIAGIFLMMPIAFAALAGSWDYVKKFKEEAVFTLGLFLVYLLLMSKHHTWGGYTGDTRYMLPFLPMLFIPLGFALERLFTMTDGALKAALSFAVFGLLFLSVRNSLLHIGFSYNYHLNLCLVHRQASLPEDWLYMAGNIFVNGSNLPRLWLVEAMIAGVTALILWIRSRLSPQEPSAQKS